jgi:hypothetical protein
MDDRSWMFRDSPQGLQRMDYCNEVQGFMNVLAFYPYKPDLNPSSTAPVMIQ